MIKNGFISTNGIRLHYIEYPNPAKPKLLFLHGLTANAHAFDGLISAGLCQNFHFISPDMRGRGLSDKPAFKYGIPSHAKDIIGLMDALEIEKIFLGGHSFGGLLSAYIAAYYPERVERIIIIDGAAKMNPNTPKMLVGSISRLGKTYPSYEAYLDKMKNAEPITFWAAEMETYYSADVKKNEDGTVIPHSRLSSIIKVSLGVASQQWEKVFAKVEQLALLINGVENYAQGEPILPASRAKHSVELLKKGHYLRVDGNHQTMLYGNGAIQIVNAINNFLSNKHPL